MKNNMISHTVSYKIHIDDTIHFIQNRKLLKKIFISNPIFLLIMFISFTL